MGWILLVDDDATQLRVRAELLCAAGFEVSAVTAGNTALALAIATAPDLDAIVTDHIVRGSTGTGLVSAIRADGVDTPVIVISGSPSAEDEYAGMQARILYKPVTPKELITILRELTSIAA